VRLVKATAGYPVYNKRDAPVSNISHAFAVNAISFRPVLGPLALRAPMERFTSGTRKHTND
jgi:hypothetical protein